jgi:hypothetical protein
MIHYPQLLRFRWSARLYRVRRRTIEDCDSSTVRISVLCSGCTASDSVRFPATPSGFRRWSRSCLPADWQGLVTFNQSIQSPIRGAQSAGALPALCARRVRYRLPQFTFCLAASSRSATSGYSPTAIAVRRWLFAVAQVTPQQQSAIKRCCPECKPGTLHVVARFTTLVPATDDSHLAEINSS